MVRVRCVRLGEVSAAHDGVDAVSCTITVDGDFAIAVD
jgi:hypothetical protein